MFKVESTPVENVLALIAKFNNGIYIPPSSVKSMKAITFRTPTTDTLCSLEITGRAGAVIEHKVKYNRVPINELLPEALEIEPGGWVNTSELLRDVATKYGIALTDDDILVKKINPSVGDSVDITIVSDHPIWLGSIPVKVVEPADSLLSLIKVVDLVLPDNEIDLKKDARLLYYGYDFTELSTLLGECEVGGKIDTELRRHINATVSHKWVNATTNKQYNMYGGAVAYNGPTELFTGKCNKKYANLMVFTLGPKCTNLKGDLFLHYN